ncbi:hypothetical protein EWM64_g3595 [Hericium alpestre]|uniref:AB hydrolase-1 domain-containing protein n=1 Tax=Hericium alpestre TaxID=135208 RepID=A0A4Z0A2H0_9AGAM|nr:hypothetical protein EWM64_g3595 [Hericium alpestre]
MPATNGHYRAPSKKASLLSLRRDEGKYTSSPDTFQSVESSASSPRELSYFERYPRQRSGSSSRADQPSSHLARSRSLLESSASQKSESSSRGSENASMDSVPMDGTEDEHHVFPLVQDTILATQFFGDGEVMPKPHRHRRPRPNTSRSRERADISHLRISGSSTQTQIETPPQTPIDFYMPRMTIDPFPVMVAAPVPDIETMDALVDGMNGYGGDDFFMGSGGISGRSRKKERFHPLYQPPLPKPPPGVTLGKPAGKGRSRPDDDDPYALPTPTSVRRPPRSLSTRPSNATITVDKTNSGDDDDDDSPPASPRSSRRGSKSVAPSISEIIRNYAPPEQRVRSRPSSSHPSFHTSSHGHSHHAVQEDYESEPEPLSPAEEAEMVSRSSMDSIANEVHQQLRKQSTSPIGPPPASHVHSLSYRHSVVSDGALNLGSPQFETTRPMSFYSSPAAPETASESPPIEFTPVKTSQSQSIAQYLRSARLTTLLKLTRGPHASLEHPLTVSLSDLGSPNGIPLVVFLGLGSVRYVMGLYDEMAEYLGIRLITIDRWGLGRTETPKHKASRGIPEWASVVEEVLDLLHIDQCSVMAHSAGAPYALSFANKVPERVRGDVLLLAPWVGGVDGAGYKWLKYVPSGILKTAQAAEWKIQAWMLGKPPTIAYEGIGYDATTSTSSNSSPVPRGSSIRQRPGSRPATADNDAAPRPSIGSSVFSEYDDLRDFDGRFDSRSTLDAKSHRNRSISESKTAFRFKRKTSRNFLNRLKGGSNGSNPLPPPQTPPSDKSPSSSGPGRKLKALRSMSSLKGKASVQAKKCNSTPPTQSIGSLKIDVGDVGLGFHPFDLSALEATTSTLAENDKDPFRAETPPHATAYNPRAGGRRSISFGAATRSSPSSLLSSPITNSGSGPSSTVTATSSYQAALGNALIVASHAESSKGVHSDLLQILNHDQQPWGFSYVTYPHSVRVWYGDKDEKIAENAVRWMERNMGGDRCKVKVVKGADHGLMYRSSVVVEVLERVRDIWTNDDS